MTQNAALKKVIISAADAAFYPLLAETIASVRDKPAGAAIAIVVLDLGLSDDQKKTLADRAVLTVKPGWDYTFATPPPEWFKAMTARTYLPKWVPGFDLYIWLDADTWVQRWEAIELLCDGAVRYGFAAASEADRAYTDIEAKTADGKDVISIEERERKLREFFGEAAAMKLRRFPHLNCGVFAARANSPIWEAWPKLMHTALHRNAKNIFFAEQTAMNVALLSGAVPFARLPAACNWLLTGAWPKVGDNGELVHPDFPHEPLGIIHRTAAAKNMTRHLRALDGSQTSVGIGYPGPKH
jgi:lipopolysaccharide biosynthesis glycosyltransferase